MNNLKNLTYFVSLFIVVGCSKQEHLSLPKQDVQISQNVPELLRDSVLHISLHGEDSNHGSLVGNCSLKSPVISGSYVDRPNVYSHEVRLIAIKTNGFVACIFKRENHIEEKTEVLFDFGKTTETNMLGWNIVGKY